MYGYINKEGSRENEMRSIIPCPALLLICKKKRHFLGVTFSKNCRVQLHDGSAECLLNAGVCAKFLALKYFKWIRPDRNQYQLTTFDLFNGAIKGAASLCNRAEIQHSRTKTHTHTHQKKKKTLRSCFVNGLLQLLTENCEKRTKKKKQNTVACRIQS